MNDWQLLLVQIYETGQDRLAPAFDHTQLGNLVLLYVAS